MLCLTGMIGRSLAAYSANTDSLYNQLNACATGITEDIECVEDVRDGLQQISDYIQDVSNLVALRHCDLGATFSNNLYCLATCWLNYPICFVWVVLVTPTINGSPPVM